MKKHVILMLCCLFALSVGKAVANTNSVMEKSVPEVKYTIHLGDVSELDADALNMMLNEAVSKVFDIQATCTLEVELNVKVAKVKLTVSDDCSTIVATTAKLVEELKHLF